ICGMIPTNLALWSLSYEMAFYMLFALTIGTRQACLTRMWGIVSVVCLCASHSHIENPILAHLCSMLSYSSAWLLGYWLCDIAPFINFRPWHAGMLLGLQPLLPHFLAVHLLGCSPYGLDDEWRLLSAVLTVP